MKELQHEINNARQMIVNALDELQKSAKTVEKPETIEALKLADNNIWRAWELCHEASMKISNLINKIRQDESMKELDARLSEVEKMLEDEQEDEEYNHAKESGDVDYSAGEGNSNIIASADYEY
jgi:hypothetical protein